MSFCCGKTGNAEDEKANAEITKFMREEKRKYESEVKLLLLGAGESGKSTLAKQMRIIHLDGFNDEERLTFKPIIYNNILQSMKNIVKFCREKGISIPEQQADVIVNSDVNNFSQKDAEAIKQIWKSEGAQEAFKRSSEFQLLDSAKYYFDDLDRIAQSNYVPTVDDVLRSRAKTTGIIEIEFTVEKTKFLLVDVGGQRSERKKWMHCFQDVTAVIFCVALSEYDLKLYEDDQTNRMHESIKLFKEICNSKWFLDTSMILFLNKRDLFEQKIKVKDLKCAFDDYTGGTNYDAALEFIKEKFQSLNENPKKHIYVHTTCATDTGQIKAVFGAVKDIVLHQVLDDSGLGI
jgi:guanine nucleotide-binding protein G(i) subunit alpha